MTREEALRILALERDDWETSHCTPYERKVAFDMAIEALKAQANCSAIPNNSEPKMTEKVQPILTCDGCRHVGTYDTSFPCNACIRREKDYYEPEG